MLIAVVLYIYISALVHHPVKMAQIDLSCLTPIRPSIKLNYYFKKFQQPTYIWHCGKSAIFRSNTTDPVFYQSILKYNSFVGYRSDIKVTIDVFIPEINATRGVYIAIRVDQASCTAFLAQGLFFFVLSDVEEVVVARNLGKWHHIFVIVFFHNKWYRMYVTDRDHGTGRPSNVDTFSSSISDCLRDVSSWKRSNRLQLNSSKTEILWCAKSRRQKLLSALLVDDVMVDSVTSVRDLGIYINADLGMRTHVQRTVSRCFAALLQ